VCVRVCVCLCMCMRVHVRACVSVCACARAHPVFARLLQHLYACACLFTCDWRLATVCLCACARILCTYIPPEFNSVGSGVVKSFNVLCRFCSVFQCVSHVHASLQISTAREQAMSKIDREEVTSHHIVYDRPGY